MPNNCFPKVPVRQKTASLLFSVGFVRGMSLLGLGCEINGQGIGQATHTCQGKREIYKQIMT